MRWGNNHSRHKCALRGGKALSFTAYGGAALMLALAPPASAQEGPFVYVPSATGDNIRIIDSSTNTVLPGVFAPADGPYEIAVRGDQSLVYITNVQADTVSVFDTATNIVTATINVGDDPFGITLSADGTRAYVANKFSNTVSVIDTATNSVTATINVGVNPWGIMLSPDGGRAYVANSGPDTVTVIDTATNSVTATIPVGDDPRSIAFSPDGDRAYVTNNFSNNVSVIDTASNSVTATIPVGNSPYDIAVSPDGARAYVASVGSDNVSVIDTATNTVIDTIATGDGTLGLAVSPDGNRLYATNTIGGTVSVIDTATNMVIATHAVGNGLAYPGMCGNGNALLAAGGTFRANNAGSLECTGADGPQFTGGTLLINTATLTSALDMTLGAAGGTVDTQGNTATFSGIISGTGALTKAGTGTFTLSGANTYSGATNVNAGVLQAGAAGAFSASSAFTVAGGAVLDLNSFNQTIGSLAGSGDVTLGAATLTAGGSNASTGFSGVMSGTGGLTKTGTGTFTLSGANTYSGATNVNAGVLQAGAAGAFSASSAFTVAGGAVLDLNSFNQTIGSLAGSGNVTLGAATLTTGGDNTSTGFFGVMSGTGGLTKTGTGTFTLSGANTFTGLTTVNAGTLVNEGSLAGGATVNDGRFSNNGMIGGAVTVAGGVYGGNGSSGALTATGGTVGPGNSIGALTVNGALNLGAGSTYQAEVTTPDAGDRINVNGTVTLGGGALVIPADMGGVYGDSNLYIIVANDGTDAVSGTFGAVTTDLAFLTPSVDYAGGTGNDVALTLARNATTFINVGTTFNQKQAGMGLQNLDQTAGSDSLAVYKAILGLSADQARAAFDSASGAVHASAQHLGRTNADLYRHALNEQSKAGVAEPSGNPAAPMGYGEQRKPAPAALALGYADAVTNKADRIDAADARVKAAWVNPLGGAGRIDGDGNAATFDWWTAGVASGFEGRGYAGSGHFVAGISGGYLHGHGDIAARASTVDANGVNLGVYGAWFNDDWTLSGSAAYAATNLRTSRDIAIGALSRTAMASYWTHSLGITAEAARNIDLGSFTLSPLATIDAGWAGHGSAMETGAGALNLAIAGESHGWFDTGLGVAIAKRFTTSANRTVTLSARAVWEHAFGSVTPRQALAFAGSPTAFNVRGPAIGRDSLRVGLGLGIQTSARTTIRARYDGSFFGSQQKHTGNVNLTVKF